MQRVVCSFRMFGDHVRVSVGTSRLIVSTDMDEGTLYPALHRFLKCNMQILEDANNINLCPSSTLLART